MHLRSLIDFVTQSVAYRRQLTIRWMNPVGGIYNFLLNARHLKSPDLEQTVTPVSRSFRRRRP